MKKAIVGVAALGAIIGLRPLARRLEQKMREHCGQMAPQCRQMAVQIGARGEAAGRT